MSSKKAKPSTRKKSSAAAARRPTTAKKKVAAKKSKPKTAKKTAKQAAKKPAVKKAKVAKKPAKKAAKPAKKAQPAKKPAKPTKPAKTPKKEGPPVYVPSSANETYMNREQLRHFGKVLEYMRRNILTNNERLVDAIKDDVQALPDENDRASKESEFTVELRERERERRLLGKVDAALVRIKNKNFGSCKECGADIGLKRLLARPVATLCIECKNLQERFEKSGIYMDD